MTTDEVVSRYNSGQSLRSIAIACCCDKKKIKTILEGAGVVIRNRHQQRSDPGQEARESIISKYSAGMSMTKIGKELGLGISIVRTTLKQAGYTIRRSNYCSKDIDQQELERLYYGEHRSTYELSKYFGCSDECLRKRLPKRRWYSEVNSIRGDDTKEKISESCKKKWQDPEYVSKVTVGTSTPEYRERLSEASRLNWENREYVQKWRNAYQNALDNGNARRNISEASRRNWQDQSYRDKIISKLRKIWENHELRAKIAASHAKRRQLQLPSRLQVVLYKYLDDLGVEYFTEGPETVVGFWTFDCRIPNGGRDILVECQGLWFHTKIAQERRDQAKFTYINKYFDDKYEIMYVWEDEFYTDNRVLDRLKLKLGLEIQTNIFEFKDVDIKPCPAKHYRSFLDAYHYIRKGRGGKCFGAYLGDQLIACCAFSAPLRNNLNGIHGKFVELSRFCIHPSYHKKNFASWFISRCLKHVDTNVIAYADTTVGHRGTIYQAANFRLHHTVPSDYWYVDQDGYVMHKLTLYRKARQMHVTEMQFASDRGYSKKYGGEKLCYVYEHK